MRNKKVLVSVLCIFVLLFTQASTVVSPSRLQTENDLADSDETVIEPEASATNPLAAEGVSDGEWQGIMGQIQHDERITYLKASNTDDLDWFGFAVAISGDTIVVGAHQEDSNARGVNGNQEDNSAEEAGAAYVFIRDTQGTWRQQAYLKASNTDSRDRFGWAVAISEDTIVVGAPFEDSNAKGVNGNQDDNSAIGAGAAYVFIRDTQGTWRQQAYLKASNTDSRDRFGWAVAISEDTIVVGAEYEGSNARGVNGNQEDNSADYAGAAYVFVRDHQGAWRQQAYLKASNTDSRDWFGFKVAISGDTIVVGAPYEGSNAKGVDGDQEDNSAEEAGAAYVFVRDAQGKWRQQAYLKASNTDKRDLFGSSIAISGDTVVVGALWEASNARGVNGNQDDNSAGGSGAAYIFVRDQQGNWCQQAYLKASNTEALDIFGIAVAISGDTIVIGAHSEASNARGVNGNQEDNSASYAGAGYVYNLSDFDLSQGFRPNHDGYSFKNYNGVNDNDLTIADLRLMFGDFPVCKAITNKHCVPRAQALKWRKKQIKMISAGRCEGMSVTSLRFFADIDDPFLYDKTFDLSKHNPVYREWGGESTLTTVRKNIAYFHVLQSTNTIIFHKFFGPLSRPSTVLTQIVDGLEGPSKEINILNMAYGVNGHAIVPYFVKKVGDNVYSIKVYDSNYPNDLNRVFMIDTALEAWEYDMGDHGGIWSGKFPFNPESKTTSHINAIPLSLYSNRPLPPWGMIPLNNSETYFQIYFDGVGELLVSDSEGRKLGYQNGDYYQEILNAYITPVSNDVGSKSSLIYLLPATETYTMSLTGDGTKEAGEATINAFGPGYAVSLEDIQVNGSTNDTIVFGSDGTEISYLPSQTQSATMSTAVDTANGSWQLEVIGVQLAPGEQQALTVDTNAEDFTLNRNNTGEGDYEIYMMRSSEDGLDMYSHRNVYKNPGETHKVRFDVFKDQNIVILDIDRNGDGVYDDSIPLENQVTKIFFPSIFN